MFTGGGMGNQWGIGWNEVQQSAAREVAQQELLQLEARLLLVLDNMESVKRMLADLGDIQAWLGLV
jgi:hypothetical protein